MVLLPLDIRRKQRAPRPYDTPPGAYPILYYTKLNYTMIYYSIPLSLPALPSLPPIPSRPYYIALRYIILYYIIL